MTRISRAAAVEKRQVYAYSGAGIGAAAALLVAQLMDVTSGTWLTLCALPGFVLGMCAGFAIFGATFTVDE